MGFRFQRRIKILPGVRLNVSKSGLSATVGVRGASINVGERGTYANLGLPGTGLSTRTRIDGGKAQPPPLPPAEAPAALDPEAVLAASPEVADTVRASCDSIDATLPAAAHAKIRKGLRTAYTRTRDVGFTLDAARLYVSKLKLKGENVSVAAEYLAQRWTREAIALGPAKRRRWPWVILALFIARVAYALLSADHTAAPAATAPAVTAPAAPAGKPHRHR
jgi:hypothetical protein